MSDTPIIQFMCAPETDEHCAVFTIRHLLPHRSTLNPCCLPRIPCCLLREHAAYTHLLDFAACSKYLSQKILWGIGSRFTDSKLAMGSEQKRGRELLEKRRGTSASLYFEGPSWQMRSGSDAIPDAAGGEGGHGDAKPQGVIHRYRIYPN
jgi:hypothetical protein